VRWYTFSVSEKGVEYMALVTPNLTVGINGYILFVKFLRDGYLNELFIHNIKVG
jgi:hypothetical protein